MQLELSASVDSGCRRSGHGAAYSAYLDAVVMFGGWPPSDELEAVAAEEANGSPLYIISAALLRVALRVTPSANRATDADVSDVSIEQPSVCWTKITAGVMPRTRHGHHLVCSRHETFLFGGSYWAHGDTVAPQDMVYDHIAGHWYQIEPLVPSRFCSAMTVSGRFSQLRSLGGGVDDTSRDDNVVLYIFGGINAAKHPTSTLFRAWLPSRSFEEILTFGSIPPPQFKSCIVADVRLEHSAAERRSGGARTEGRLFHLDGFLPDTSRVKRLHVLDLSTDIWREVCFAPDLVRSQIAYISYTDPPLSMEHDAATHHQMGRVASFTVFGGMPSQKGKRFRSSGVATFNTTTMMWDQSKLLHAAVPGVTAHVVVEMPAVGTKHVAGGGRGGAKSPLFIDHLVSVSICGNEDDPQQPEENSLGRQTSSLHFFFTKPCSLKELAARQIHQMRIPCHINASPNPRDEILDELF